jgi:CoA:oxalate CoA-transferase
MTGRPAAPGALEGVRVLDLTRVYAGPFCTMLLADLGADVVKIEHPREPDYVRFFRPLVGDPQATDLSGYFVALNRNKRAMTLDLKHPEGRRVFLRLVGRADVVVENFAPRVMAGLGLGFEELARANARVVVASISGFGHTGPNRDRPSFDGNAQAMGGIWNLTGYPDRPPVRTASALGDSTAGLFCAVGILAALRHREATGRGQHVDISQQDSIFAILEAALPAYSLTGQVPQRQGSAHPIARPYDLFPCKDGYVFFGGYSDKLWRKTCEVMGEPEFARRPDVGTMVARQEPETYERVVRPKILEWFARYTKAELEAKLAPHAPLAPILDVAECAANPQLNAREMVLKLRFPGADVLVAGSPVKLSAAPFAVRRLPPHHGEHTAEVLAEAGIGAPELERLRGAGVV